MITINRGDSISIGFTIDDDDNALGGARVTLAIGTRAGGDALLEKASGLGGVDTADVTILSQTAAQIVGEINMLAADYVTLVAGSYFMSLWVDDGTGNERCATDGGVDTLKINAPVKRA